MAKRFIDTGLFDDPWFMDLSKDGKIAWVFLITKCDHAGIIQVNDRLFKVMTGINSFTTVRQELADRLVSLRDNYFFLPKFIYYQYPDFPKSNVNAQTGAIRRLMEFGLYSDGKLTNGQDIANSSPTLRQEIMNSCGSGYGYEYDSTTEKGGMGEKTENKKIETWRESFDIYIAEMKDEFEKTIKDPEWIKKQEKYNPGVNIVLTIEKAIDSFWGTDYGWKHKKKGKYVNNDWRSTFAKTISVKTNRVYSDQNTLSSKPDHTPKFEAI